MEKISVTINKKLPLGTLLWIYSSNGKMFHSTKRFDKKNFTNHDTVKLGNYQDACFGSEGYLSEMLKQTNRIYGINTEEKKAYFFLTLDEVYSFGKAYFTTIDQMNEAKRKEQLDKIKRLKQEEEQKRWSERSAALEIHNKKYSGTLFPPAFRESHCFRCKSYLYSSTHPNCPVCNWMKCNCGGCECNYKK